MYKQTKQEPRIVAECWTCMQDTPGRLSIDSPGLPTIPLQLSDDAYKYSLTIESHRAAGHDVRPVSSEDSRQ